MHRNCGVPSRSQFLLPRSYPAHFHSISQFPGIRWVVEREKRRREKEMIASLVHARCCWRAPAVMPCEL